MIATFLRGRRCDIFYLLVRVDRQQDRWAFEVVVDEHFAVGKVLWTKPAHTVADLFKRSKMIDVYREMLG